MKKVARAAACMCFWLASIPIVAAETGDVALVGAKVYTSPAARPIDNALILIHNGRIEFIGERGKRRMPPDARVIDCAGKVVTAGFWNSHVHFTEDAWEDAVQAPAERLKAHMREMLSRWGFTSVFDIASVPENTLSLRKRVESGEIPGPRIYTTAGEIYPQGGIPVYVPDKLARQLTSQQASTPQDAARLARREMELGGDGIKLFTGAIVRGEVLPMDVPLIEAAVEIAHAAGKPAFAHPSNHIGTDNALAGGVDVLAHLIPMETDWTPQELRRMKQQRTAVIPTIAMFMDEERKFGGGEDEKRMVLSNALRQLKEVSTQGGTILFGTDVGYTQVYDTTSEYEYMAQAGMSWRDILSSLTTAPSSFFKAEDGGSITEAGAADLVILDGDPAVDVRAFAKVAYTIRSGEHW